MLDDFEKGKKDEGKQREFVNQNLKVVEKHGRAAIGNLMRGVGHLRNSLQKVAGSNTDAVDSGNNACGALEDGIQNLLAIFDHLSELAAANKAEGTADLVKIGDRTVMLVPTSVSGVAPDAPSGARPVLRPGQPNLNASMPKVDVAFEHLVKCDE